MLKIWVPRSPQEVPSDFYILVKESIKAKMDARILIQLRLEYLKMDNWMRGSQGRWIKKYMKNVNIG